MESIWNMNMTPDENTLAMVLELISRLQGKPQPHSPKTAERLAAALRDRDMLAARVRAAKEAR